MKSYGQFCPVAQALEVLAERWTLLVVRELLMGSTRFTEIARGVPQMSRTMLSQRLTTLVDAGILVRREGEGGPAYSLTPRGEALRPVVESIGHWGKAHAAPLRDEQLDPKLVMWDVQRRIHVDRIPRERTVVLFRFHDVAEGESRYWLHLARPDVDLCLTGAGFDVDLTVESELRAFVEVWMGRLAFADAVRARKVQLRGARPLQQAFPGWLKLSVFA